MIEEQDERLQPLINAAEQFIASCNDGDVESLLAYYKDIFTEALAAKEQA